MDEGLAMSLFFGGSLPVGLLTVRNCVMALAVAIGLTCGFIYDGIKNAADDLFHKFF